MRAYWVSVYREIFDENKMAVYASMAKPVIEKLGGKFLARSRAVYASGRSGLKERTVSVEWASLDDAQKAYRSGDYQKALKALGDGVDRDFRIVEGT